MPEKNKPKFKPKAGQVDFSNARWAPVVNSVISYKNKILLVERNSQLNFYPGYWNGVSGFLDDEKSLEEKVKEELREELEMGESHILSIHLCDIFDQEEPKYNKTWIVHAVMVKIDTDEVKLDWEAQKYAWVTPEEIKNYKLLPGFDRVLEAVLPKLEKGR